MCVCVCVCVWLYIHMRVDQKFLSLTQILDLSPTSHLCKGLTSTEIKTEIQISFSRSIRSDCVLPQQKCH